MDTGKVEYAPDYKSRIESAMDEGRKIAESVIAANRAAAERERLEREVIEQAKKWHTERIRIRNSTVDADTKLGESGLANDPLDVCTKALIDFESSQQQIKK